MIKDGFGGESGTISFLIANKVKGVIAMCVAERLMIILLVAIRMIS